MFRAREALSCDSEVKMHVGAMVWRTGAMLDLYEQIAWFRERGFGGIAFHTGPCYTGGWSSFDVRRASAADRRRLADAVSGFTEVSIHGEFDLFDVILCSPNERVRRASVETLRGSLELAAEIGAAVVTTHEGSSRVSMPAEVRRDALARSIDDLAEITAPLGVTVGFELTRDYDLVVHHGGPVGITLDVGHVSFEEGAGYRDFGSIGGLVRSLGRKLVHVHVHDYDGRHDHLPVGGGGLDFAEIVEALKEIGYDGMLCLELSPDACGPEGYLESRGLLLRLIAGD